MATKIIYIGGVPSVTTGSDVSSNGPLSPAQVDQIHRNLQSAVDTLAASQTVAQSGTYTINVWCGTSGSVSLSSSAGWYVKRDGLLTATICFTVSSVSSPQGAIGITLPFSTPGGMTPAVAIDYTGLTASSNRLTANISPGGGVVIYEDVNGTHSETAAQRLKAGSTISVTVNCFV